jgi:hypothetical protein
MPSSASLAWKVLGLASENEFVYICLVFGQRTPGGNVVPGFAALEVVAGLRVKRPLTETSKPEAARVSGLGVRGRERGIYQLNNQE